MFNKRLFLACPIESADLYTQLCIVRKNLSAQFPDVAFDWEFQPHITLRFIGDVNLIDSKYVIHEMWRDLKYITDRAAPFDMTLGYLHTFPGVLWVSLGGSEEEDERLEYLALHTGRAVDRQGFPAADFSFIPHITIGRFDKSRTESVVEGIKDSDYPDPIEFALNRVDLMESFRDINKKTVYRPVSADYQFQLNGGSLEHIERQYTRESLDV